MNELLETEDAEAIAPPSRTAFNRKRLDQIAKSKALLEAVNKKRQAKQGGDTV
jgi:hypothetical protein